jgi:hypothetical protein
MDWNAMELAICLSKYAGKIAVCALTTVEYPKMTDEMTTIFAVLTVFLVASEMEICHYNYCLSHGEVILRPSMCLAMSLAFLWTVRTSPDMYFTGGYDKLI